MGAIEIAGTWRIAAPVTALWEVVVDLRTWPRWWPAIRDVAPLQDGDTDAARFTFDTPSALPPLVLELTVSQQEAPHHLVAVASDGPLAGEASVTLDEHDDHIAVAFDVRLRIRSLLFRPLGTVLAGATRSGGRQRLRQAGDDLAALAGGEPLDHDV